MAEISANAVIARLQPGRRPDGIVAVLMPFLDGSPDYGSLARQIRRVSQAGLTTAVNMDTGYVQWLSPAQRGEALAASSIATVTSRMNFSERTRVPDRSAARWRIALVSCVGSSMESAAGRLSWGSVCG